MSHDERHYPCQSKEREKIKTKDGYQLICKSCGHGFKEIKKEPTKIGSRMPAPSKMKRKYKKKGDRLAVGPAGYMNEKEAQIRAIEEKLGLKVPVEQAVSDITKGLEQIFAGYTAIFMQLRLLVIKEKGKVFNMAKAAGIQITGEDIQE